MKVTVVGAGNVGATCANVLATREVANEVVLLDIKDGFAEGKALDIWETAPINLYDTRTVGSTNDYSKTAGSDVVVITSGLPRKPGMSRDDLIATNAGIVKTVTENVMKHSPDAILVIVSNPLDVMTYCAYLNANIDSKRVFGMAGILDTARYRAFLAEELNVSPKDIQAVLMGGHGDTMVPLPRYTTVGGIPVTEMIDADKLDAIVERTKKGEVRLSTCWARQHGMHQARPRPKWWKPSCATSAASSLAAHGCKASTASTTCTWAFP